MKKKSKRILNNQKIIKRLNIKLARKIINNSNKINRKYKRWKSLSKTKKVAVQRAIAQRNHSL